MTANEIAALPGFSMLCPGDFPERTVTGAYCCDLLSFVMARAPEGCAWATVMGNVNAIAVASLADVCCVIIADSVTPDAAALQKAAENGICVIGAKAGAFHAALAVHEAMANETS